MSFIDQFEFTNRDELPLAYKKWLKVFSNGDSDSKRNACTALADKKKSVCHPPSINSTYKNDTPPAKECTLADSLETLRQKHNAFFECRNLRLIEVKSRCFEKEDPGHVHQIAIEDRKARRCQSLYNEKKQRSKSKSRSKRKIKSKSKSRSERKTEEWKKVSYNSRRK